MRDQLPDIRLLQEVASLSDPSGFAQFRWVPLPPLEDAHEALQVLCGLGTLGLAKCLSQGNNMLRLVRIVSAVQDLPLDLRRGWGPPIYAITEVAIACSLEWISVIERVEEKVGIPPQLCPVPRSTNAGRVKISLTNITMFQECTAIQAIIIARAAI